MQLDHPLPRAQPPRPALSCDPDPPHNPRLMAEQRPVWLQVNHQDYSRLPPASLLPPQKSAAVLLANASCTQCVACYTTSGDTLSADGDVCGSAAATIGNNLHGVKSNLLELYPRAAGFPPVAHKFHKCLQSRINFAFI